MAIKERLELALAVRQRLNRITEIVGNIEEMVTGLSALSTEWRELLAKVLTVNEAKEMNALWNLAQIFLADVRAAAPTLLATETPYHAPAEDTPLGGV